MKYIKLSLIILLMIGTAQAKTWTDVVESTAPPAQIEFTKDGRERKHIILFRLYSEAEPDISRIRDDAEWLQNYWRYQAPSWNIEVQGFNLQTTCRPLAPYYCQRQVNEWFAMTDLGTFMPNYIHVYGGHHSSYCGQAIIGDNWSVTYNPGSCGVLTMAHELGHNFRWHHAGTLNLSTGNETEYGDGSAIMGGSYMGQQGLIANNLIQEYMGETTNIIETTQQIIVAPLEINPVGLHEGEIQHHIIVTSSHESQDRYTISLRQKLGAHFPPDDPAQSLFIHQVRSNGKTKRVGVLYPGQDSTIPGGITIEYLEWDRERARVNVLIGEVNLKPEDKIIRHDWILPEEAHIFSAHDGAWYDPTHDGQGFIFQIKNNFAGVYWFTYNIKTDERRWYYGVCSLPTCMSGFTIYTTSGGTFNNPASRMHEIAGQAQFFFTSPKTGMFNYRTSEQGIGSIPLTAIALTQPDNINGSWYDPHLNGSGFTFQNLGHVLGVYWFTYGPRDVNVWAPARNATQRWYMALGTANNGSYDLTIYEAQDGRFLWPGKINLTIVGSATVTPEGGYLKFEYNIDAERVISTGTYQLHKLF